MRILQWGRQTGKTTECIETLKANEDACLITPVYIHSHYNALLKNTRKRCFSSDDIYMFSKGKNFKKAIIDEVDFLDKKAVEMIMKYFDVILIAGTPQWKSPNFSWLVKKYPDCVEKRTWRTSMENIKSMTVEAWRTEVQGEFKLSLWEKFKGWFRR